LSSRKTSPACAGYGAQNMALVRRLAFNMIRAGKGRYSIKTGRKMIAMWVVASMRTATPCPVA
jgi:hypothetical protein